MQQEFVLAGVGGQGILVGSQLLGHAALIEGKRAMYFSMFMAAQRGGSCECLIAIGDGRIEAAPVIIQPLTANVSMHPNAFMRFEPVIRPGGLLVYNTSIKMGSTENVQVGMSMALKANTRMELSPSRDDIAYMALPASDLALNELGNQLMATLIALGAFIEVTGVVALESAQKAVSEALPSHRQHLVPINQEALAVGSRYAREHGALQNASALSLLEDRRVATAI